MSVSDFCMVASGDSDRLQLKSCKAWFLSCLLAGRADAIFKACVFHVSCACASLGLARAVIEFLPMLVFTLCVLFLLPWVTICKNYHFSGILDFFLFVGGRVDLAYLVAREILIHQGHSCLPHFAGAVSRSRELRTKKSCETFSLATNQMESKHAHPAGVSSGLTEQRA